ncbi:hypothetical protein LTR62_004487 [Meristemomyces frigidus]|uniref:Uncharacterized protein n=1 Tax=Meristemomyces frigidus TaxID=1508187 RepID=A0AAN7YG35_9PEZI|nr:hypothetical protein LTR62_004487 [Meristemomyces frigidus]
MNFPAATHNHFRPAAVPALLKITQQAFQVANSKELNQDGPETIRILKAAAGLSVPWLESFDRHQDDLSRDGGGSKGMRSRLTGRMGRYVRDAVEEAGREIGRLEALQQGREGGGNEGRRRKKNKRRNTAQGDGRGEGGDGGEEGERGIGGVIDGHGDEHGNRDGKGNWKEIANGNGKGNGNGGVRAPSLSSAEQGSEHGHDRSARRHKRHRPSRNVPAGREEDGLGANSEGRELGDGRRKRKEKRRRRVRDVSSVERAGKPEGHLRDRESDDQTQTRQRRGQKGEEDFPPVREMGVSDGGVGTEILRAGRPVGLGQAEMPRAIRGPVERLPVDERWDPNSNDANCAQPCPSSQRCRQAKDTSHDGIRGVRDAEGSAPGGGNGAAGLPTGVPAGVPQSTQGPVKSPFVKSDPASRPSRRSKEPNHDSGRDVRAMVGSVTSGGFGTLPVVPPVGFGADQESRRTTGPGKAPYPESVPSSRRDPSAKDAGSDSVRGFRDMKGPVRGGVIGGWPVGVPVGFGTGQVPQRTCEAVGAPFSGSVPSLRRSERLRRPDTDGGRGVRDVESPAGGGSMEGLSTVPPVEFGTGQMPQQARGSAKAPSAEFAPSSRHSRRPNGPDRYGPGGVRDAESSACSIEAAFVPAGQPVGVRTMQLPQVPMAPAVQSDATSRHSWQAREAGRHGVRAVRTPPSSRMPYRREPSKRIWQRRPGRRGESRDSLLSSLVEETNPSILMSEENGMQRDPEEKGRLAQTAGGDGYAGQQFMPVQPKRAPSTLRKSSSLRGTSPPAPRRGFWRARPFSKRSPEPRTHKAGGDGYDVPQFMQAPPELMSRSTDREARSSGPASRRSGVGSRSSTTGSWKSTARLASPQAFRATDPSFDGTSRPGTQHSPAQFRAGAPIPSPYVNRHIPVHPVVISPPFDSRSTRTPPAAYDAYDRRSGSGSGSRSKLSGWFEDVPEGFVIASAHGGRMPRNWPTATQHENEGDFLFSRPGTSVTDEYAAPEILGFVPAPVSSISGDYASQRYQHPSETSRHVLSSRPRTSAKDDYSAERDPAFAPASASFVSGGYASEIYEGPQAAKPPFSATHYSRDPQLRGHSDGSPRAGVGEELDGIERHDYGLGSNSSSVDKTPSTHSRQKSGLTGSRVSRENTTHIQTLENIPNFQCNHTSSTSTDGAGFRSSSQATLLPHHYGRPTPRQPSVRSYVDESELSGRERLSSIDSGMSAYEARDGLVSPPTSQESTQPHHYHRPASKLPSVHGYVEEGEAGRAERLSSVGSGVSPYEIEHSPSSAPNSQATMQSNHYGRPASITPSIRSYPEENEPDRSGRLSSVDSRTSGHRTQHDSGSKRPSVRSYTEGSEREPFERLSSLGPGMKMYGEHERNGQLSPHPFLRGHQSSYAPSMAGPETSSPEAGIAEVGLGAATPSLRTAAQSRVTVPGYSYHSSTRANPLRLSPQQPHPRPSSQATFSTQSKAGSTRPHERFSSSLAEEEHYGSGSRYAQSRPFNHSEISTLKSKAGSTHSHAPPASTLAAVSEYGSEVKHAQSRRSSQARTSTSKSSKTGSAHYHPHPTSALVEESIPHSRLKYAESRRPSHAATSLPKTKAGPTRCHSPPALAAEAVPATEASTSMIDMGFARPVRRKKCHHAASEAPSFCDSVAGTESTA